MLFNVIAVVLGIAAVVVYVTGVRQGREWGTPVMTLLVIGAVVAVILPLTGLDERMRGSVASRLRRSQMQSPQMLGEALAPRLSEGASVLVIKSPDESYRLTRQWRGQRQSQEGLEEVPTVEEQVEADNRDIREAFEEGAGVSVNIVGTVTPGEDLDVPGEAANQPADAPAFNDWMEPYEDENVEAVISLAGLPRYEGAYELEDLACFEEDNPPMFAAVAGSDYDPQVVREYIEEGLLTAVVLRPGEGEARIAVTEDNLGDLPE